MSDDDDDTVQLSRLETATATARMMMMMMFLAAWLDVSKGIVLVRRRFRGFEANYANSTT